MIHLYVSPNGRDTWTGRTPSLTQKRSDGPFATLERARDEVRRLKSAGKLGEGVTVEARGGRYERKGPFTLTAEDSGTTKVPVTYRAYGNERVVLTGGRAVTGFRPVTDPAVRERLPKAARGHVLVADLKAQGITDFGTVAEAGRRVELFYKDAPMTLARWPNTGFVTIEKLTGRQPLESNGIKGDKAGVFTYTGDEPRRWADEPDPWLHGYWFWDWADEFQRVKSIDPTTRTIALAEPYHGYGYRAGQRYYALNLLSELDRPGEWYLDRTHGLLYFWPPSPITASAPVLSVLPTLIAAKDASWVTFRGFTLEATRSTAVQIVGGTHDRVAACTVRNTGSWGVRVEGGDHHTVAGCDVYNTGEGGIYLNGGDRKTLTPSGHVAENNHLYNFGRIYRTYRPAVGVDGVGVRVAHNLIHDGPHNAILLGGNDHVIEFNEIYRTCLETGDVGAFYMGRDWTARGTVIRHNFFHDIHGPGLYGAMAVYLDDAASGISIFGNVFYKAGSAAFIGGGRDNLVENNVFVECEPSVHVDARGLNWMKYHVEPGGTLPTRLAEMPYKTPPWSTRYPKLVSILEDDPGAPKGNVIARNVSVGGKWKDVEKVAEPLVTFKENLVDADPHFVDAGKMNFQLRPDSPAYKEIGFQRIPFERIGLVKDTDRSAARIPKKAY